MKWIRTSTICRIVGLIVVIVIVVHSLIVSHQKLRLLPFWTITTSSSRTRQNYQQHQQEGVNVAVLAYPSNNNSHNDTVVSNFILEKSDNNMVGQSKEETDVNAVERRTSSSSMLLLHRHRYENDSNEAALAARTRKTIENSESVQNHMNDTQRLPSVVIINPYTQNDISRLVHDSVARLHVLLMYHPEKISKEQEHTQFHLYSLSPRWNEPTACACKERLVELIIDGLMTFVNQRHHHHRGGGGGTAAALNRWQQQSPLQLVLDTTNDYTYYSCMDDDDDDKNVTTIPSSSSSSSCDKKHYPPLITIGSVPRGNNYNNNNNNHSSSSQQQHHPSRRRRGRRHSLFLHQFPLKHYNNCLYNWRIKFMNRDQKTRPCDLRYIQQFPTTRKRLWSKLHSQIYWRGSSLSFLSMWKQFRHLQQCDEVLVQKLQHQQQQEFNHNRTTSIPFSLTATQAVELLLAERHRLNPRCLAATWTLQAEANVTLQSDNINNNTSTSTSSRSSIHQKRKGTTTNKSTNKSNSSFFLLPWINVKYTRNSKRHLQLYEKRGFSYFLDDFTSPGDMAQYKYQIDLGGVGGTTWLGTITKLAMPGLLFHHVTPTKDWFHDDDDDDEDDDNNNNNNNNNNIKKLQPWVHYVPIHTNLSNLYDMFVWAETHPNEAMRIARAGQEYARYHASDKHYQATFDKMFVEQVGQIASAYHHQPSSLSSGGDTLASILEVYQADGIYATHVAICNEINCDFSSPMMDKKKKQS